MTDTVNYEDKAVQREIRHIFSRMGLCGCGTGYQYEIVKAMLERAEGKGSFYEPMPEHGLNEVAVEFIAHVMNSDHWGLMEHGGSVGYAWLTDDGKKLLDFLKHFGADKDEWPEWWCSCEAGEEW